MGGMFTLLEVICQIKAMCLQQAIGFTTDISDFMKYEKWQWTRHVIDDLSVVLTGFSPLVSGVK